MTALWGDYVGYPGGAALRAAGFTGVVRYVGIGGAAKRLTRSEYADLTAHGLQVLGVVESTTTEADNGYAAGVADARAALADLAQLGATSIPVLFATNDKPTYLQADVDYVRGFASVVGVQRTGAYGFASFLTAVRQAGCASVFWQAGNPPNLTGTQGWVHFWQRQGTRGDGTDGPAAPTTVTVGGVAVDIDNQLQELPNMTTLDDAKQSLVPGSTVSLPLWQYILNSDMYGYENKAALAALETQVSAIQGALAADEAALLGAIKAIPAPVVTQINADPVATAAALMSSGLPAHVVDTLLTLLTKAAA